MNCEACGDDLFEERSFGAMHSRCVERLLSRQAEPKGYPSGPCDGNHSRRP